MEIVIPDMYQKSIYTINYDLLKENGIKCLLFDLDNTCVPFVAKEPTKKLINLFDDLKSMDFKIIIFSNATKKRLMPFKKKLLVDCSYKSGKPFKKKLIKVMKDFKFNLPDVAIIGDQLFTDVLVGNRVGIMTILVNPMSNEDFLHTRITRLLLEQPAYKKMAKKGFLIKGKYYE